jgi:F-type H+-transporting ATPase subunit delta
MRIADPVARRYARALFAAAAARDALDAVAVDLAAVRQFLQTETRVRSLLTIPLMTIGEEQALIERLFGGRVHALVIELLQLLLEKKRFGILADVQDAFAARLDQERGIRRARVTSAVVLPEDLAERLRGALAAHTGAQVVLERQVDARLIGGLRVQLGDEVIEGSVRRALENLRAALQAIDIHEN